MSEDDHKPLYESEIDCTTIDVVNGILEKNKDDVQFRSDIVKGRTKDMPPVPPDEIPKVTPPADNSSDIPRGIKIPYQAPTGDAAITAEFQDALSRNVLRDSQTVVPRMLRAQGPILQSQRPLRGSRLRVSVMSQKGTDDKNKKSPLREDQSLNESRITRGRLSATETIKHNDPLRASRVNREDIEPVKATLGPYLDEECSLSLSDSSLGERNDSILVPIAIPTELIEMVPKCSDKTPEEEAEVTPGADADIEYVIDMEGLAQFYDKFVFCVQEDKVVERRFLSLSLKEFKDKFKIFLFQLMIVIRFYMYPMKTGKTGCPPDDIELLFDGVEQMFDGMLSIFDIMRKKTDCTATVDEPDEELEKTICGCSDLMNGYVTYAKHQDKRMRIIHYIVNEKDARYKSLQEYLVDTASVCKNRLEGLFDNMLQFLPKLDDLFRRITVYCGKLGYTNTSDSFTVIRQFFKELMTRANLETWVFNAEERIITRLEMRKSERKFNIDDVKGLRKHTVVDYINDEEHYGYIIILYKDLLLLVNTTSENLTETDVDLKSKRGIEGLRIDKWIDFSEATIVDDPATSNIRITIPSLGESGGMSSFSLFMFSDDFHKLIIDTYNQYKKTEKVSDLESSSYE